MTATRATTQNIFELDGPAGNFILGNLTELGDNPLGFLMQCAHGYGDIIPLRFGLTPACLVTNPKLIEQVLNARESFIKSRGFRALRTLLGNGLLTNEGESWFRQRRLAQPVFHRKRIEGYERIMVDYTEQMLKTWKPGTVCNIHIHMMRLTLNIVMKTVFNQDIAVDEAETVAHAFDVAMHWFDSKRRQNFFILEWFPRPENIRYRNAINAMNETIYRVIRQRRESGEYSGDLLSMLMTARDEDEGTTMDDHQLRDEVATLMLAGYETTANTLSWTWMLLSLNPEIEIKLHAELQNVLQGNAPTLADLPHMPYTNAVIKESMRLYPPVALLGREAIEDVEIGDYLIPQGCVVMLSQWVMHHNEKYFEEAESFNPERWLGDLEKQLPRGVYFPFGDGPRICIGKSFAMMEAVLILATVAQQYSLRLLPKQQIVPQPSFTLRPPTQGIHVTLEKRK